MFNLNISGKKIKIKVFVTYPEINKILYRQKSNKYGSSPKELQVQHTDKTDDMDIHGLLL